MPATDACAVRMACRCLRRGYCSVTRAATYLEDELRWATWMARAQKGDQGVYRSLLEEVGAAIEAYIRVHFGAIDILEDCVQECLMTIHQARHTYDPTRLFRPWLFTLVRHETIDVLRQRQCRVELETTLPDEVGDTGPADHLGRLIDGINVLRRLSPEHRETVALVKYRGMTTAEAAVTLGLSEPAVKARLHRALIAIRLDLERDEPSA